jgi:hypothetical protein
MRNALFRLEIRPLYDLVWATPMVELAESFGLSEVGLAKICDRHRGPTPPPGYWAKKNAGKKVKQTIFVQVDDPLLDRIDLAPSRDMRVRCLRDGGYVCELASKRGCMSISCRPQPAFRRSTCHG